MSSPPASPGSKKRREAAAAAAAAKNSARKDVPSATSAGGKPGAAPGTAGVKDGKPKTKKELEAERAAQEEAEKHRPPATGSGQFEFPNGAVYEGEWQETAQGGKLRHGFGRFVSGGERFEGNWVLGHIQGRGKMHFASGAVYDGEWLADRFHGRGSYVWPSGSSYIGDWVENKMHGVGAFLAAHTGDRYQGMFHNDRFLNAQGHWIAPQDDAGNSAEESKRQ